MFAGRRGDAAAKGGGAGAWFAHASLSRAWTCGGRAPELAAAVDPGARGGGVGHPSVSADFGIARGRGGRRAAAARAAASARTRWHAAHSSPVKCWCAALRSKATS
jgi:hypothetical protein